MGVTEVVAQPPFYGRAAWRAEQPRYTTPWRQAPDGAVTHYLGFNPSGWSLTPTLQRSLDLVKGIQSGALSKGLPDIEYSFLFDPVGRVFEGRGWRVQSGANGRGVSGLPGSNERAFAFCYMGGPAHDLTPAGAQAALWLVQEAARRYDSMAYVMTHNQVLRQIGDATGCPGIPLTRYTPFLQVGMRPLPTTPGEALMSGMTAAALVPGGVKDAQGQRPFVGAVVSAATGETVIIGFNGAKLVNGVDFAGASMWNIGRLVKPITDIDFADPKLAVGMAEDSGTFDIPIR